MVPESKHNDNNEEKQLADENYYIKETSLSNNMVYDEDLK